MITTLGPVTDIQVDDLGRIYALSSSNGVWALMRLSSSGELDTNFADQGILSSTTALIRVLVQSDRRLILLSGQGGAGVIRRFDENGAPDTTYATLGQFVLPPATSIHDGDLLANDELLICGDSATTWSSVYRAFVIRLDMDGNLDTGFADDGWLITSGFANACTGTTWEGIEVRDMGDGGFVAVKYSETIEQCTPNPDMAKLRFSVHDANGVEVSGFNTMFNPFGISVTPYSISVEPGQGFDLAYGWEGEPVLRHSTVDCQWTSLCAPCLFFQGATSIGRTCHDQQSHWFLPTQDQSKFKVYRVMPGTLGGDCDWGTSGMVVTEFSPGGSGRARVARVQPDGRLLAGGHASQANLQVFALARYHNIPDPRAKLDLKLFLGGPMDTNTGLMHDSLRAQGLLPLQQPYLDSTFQSVNGVGAGITSVSVLNETGAEAAVDWVWLELLDAADTATVVATRTGLLWRNGKVTSPINHDPIDFSVGAGSYFLRVRHRNHLGVTLSDPIAMSDSVVSVDLSDPNTNTFGTDAQKEVNGVRVLWPGDVHHDGLVRYAGAMNDRDAVLVSIGGTPPTATATGYKDADVNMDGIVKYAGADNDRDVILQSIGGGYPTAVRFEQRP
ncbi:MAG: hypothetical protein IPG69_03670 [Flavobacteriales bacterium]|nr:hypothetical protein [Flavobacteriales bacterium]